MSDIVKIVEDVDFSFKDPIAVECLPDVGLVGSIAAFHIIEQLGLKEVAHFESDLFPPIMVLHKGILQDPVRIYGKEDLIVLTSEIPMPVNTIHQTANVLSKWFKEKNVRLELSISGIPAQDRVKIKTPKVFSVGNGSESRELLKKLGINLMEEGFVAGFYALILKELTKIGMPAIALLAQSFLKYPDPSAAASAILAFNKIAGTNVEVKNLLEKGDDIRMKARDLMNQTEGTMNDMQKTVEQTIPMMYR